MSENTKAFEREMAVRRKEEHDAQQALRNAVREGLPPRLEEAKTKFLEEAEISNAAFSDLEKRLSALIVPYTGLSHVRTRWGLRYSFADAHDAARNAFDREHKVEQVVKPEDAMQHIVNTRRGEACQNHAIKTRMLNDDFNEYVILPVVEKGNFLGFKIQVNTSEVIAKSTVSIVEGRIKREILTPAEAEEYMKGRLRRHIEEQRGPVRFGGRVAAAATTAAAAVALAGFGISKLPEEIRRPVAEAAQNIPFVKGP